MEEAASRKTNQRPARFQRFLRVMVDGFESMTPALLPTRLAVLQQIPRTHPGPQRQFMKGRSPALEADAWDQTSRVLALGSA